MTAVVVVGAQWGDEGKGKAVDFFAENAEVVVRFAGGANAGHTLVLGDTQLVTHLVPSGVLHPGTLCVLGAGMVIDLETLCDEIAQCRSRKLLAPPDLLISERAHIILPYHRELESIRESSANAIGTTRRGIGPAYEAKAGRRGVRLADLVNAKRLRERIDQNLDELAPVFEAHGVSVPSTSQRGTWVERTLTLADGLMPSIGNAGRVVADAVSVGKAVLFEGAQGALLDVDHGTYPYVTSSTTTAAGACSGVGVGPTVIDRVIGITKAYCTRVGAGPFPTEMGEETAPAWREAGGEYGATTGRPRRCGWLDLAALKTAVRINGITELAVTKLDVLSGRGPIQVGIGYRDQAQGIVHDELPVHLGAHLETVYRQFEGWDDDLSEARKLSELPSAARTYIDAISEHLHIPICLVSVGPKRRETVVLTRPFASSGS